MFDGVDYVRSVCDRHGIPVSKLEKDCGFSNGYLNPKKLKKIPFDRALVIADYLSQFEPVSAEYILTGKEKAPTQEGERKITADDFTYAMYSETKDLSPDTKERILQMARFFAEEERKKGK